MSTSYSGTEPTNQQALSCNLKPFIIGHSENPHAFRGLDQHQLPVMWRSNKKGWPLFKLVHVNRRMKFHKINILLFMDNTWRCVSVFFIECYILSIEFLLPKLTQHLVFNHWLSRTRYIQWPGKEVKRMYVPGPVESVCSWPIRPQIVVTDTTPFCLINIHM